MQRFIDLDEEIFAKGPEAMSHPVMATDLIDDDEDEDDDTVRNYTQCFCWFDIILTLF
jgi:hypothetical protein